MTERMNHRAGSGTGRPSPRSEPFLPDFCTLDSTLVLVMSSLGLGLALTLADFSADRGFLADFGLRAFFVIWIALLAGGALCLLGPRLRRLDASWAGLAAFGVIQAATLLVSLFALISLSHLGYEFGGGLATSEQVLRILAVSSLAAAAWLRYQFVQARWRQHSRAEALARLDALQSRMRPHFLFNALNSIAGIMREDPARAEELLLDLAEVLRAVLRQDTQLVSLAREFELTRQYLRIEQLRLGQRLQVEWDLRGVPESALIPPLSLQPLVENAIRHGIERADEGGRLDIAGRRSGDRLVLTISNTLPTNASPGRSGNGQAMANLRARLAVCFQDRAGLYCSLVDGRYQARMVLPCPGDVHEASASR